MRAVWYERQGPAAEVLTTGEMAEAVPGPGEVRVRLTHSGINPGDTKKRMDAFGVGMAFPRVVPHSDGAGVIDLVGAGVDPRRVGRRVWVWGAQSYRPFGTAAQCTVVPTDRAVDLPEGIPDAVGACLGIPGFTAHRAVFGDGDVAGQTVLVHGVLGGVGACAAALARWGGARVIGTVRRASDLAEAERHGDQAVALDGDPVRTIRALAPEGVDRVIEVAFAANAALNSEVVRQGATIAAYATDADPAPWPFWSLLFANTRLLLVGSDDLTDQARADGVADLSAALTQGFLRPTIAAVLPLEECAAAHDLVDAGTRGRVLLDVQA